MPEGVSEPATWTSSDAWILASLSSGRRGMTLSELIASADAHNHAIPTRDELASALGGLVGTGLVEATRRGFRTTRKGMSVKRQWTGGMFQWTSLLPELEKLEKIGDDYPLTETEVREAYTAYIRRT